MQVNKQGDGWEEASTVWKIKLNVYEHTGGGHDAYCSFLIHRAHYTVLSPCYDTLTTPLAEMPIRLSPHPLRSAHGRAWRHCSRVN